MEENMNLKKCFITLILIFCLSCIGFNLLGTDYTIPFLKYKHPYYDSLYLFNIIKECKKNEKLTENEISKVQTILKKYLHDDPRDFSLQEFKNSFSCNPFIKEFLNLAPLTLTENHYRSLSSERNTNFQAYIQQNIKSLSENATPNNSKGITGISPAAIAEGMAKFLVERAKSELSIAFFEKFKRILEDDKYKAIKILLPSTHSALKTIDTEIYNFSAYIQVLRGAFETDLRNLLLNLPKIMTLPEVDNFFKEEKHKWLKVLLDSGFYLITCFKNEEIPNDILMNFDLSNFETNNKDDNFTNFINAIKLIQIISKSFQTDVTDNQNSGYWINMASFKKLFDNYGSFYAYKIYIGLLYEETKDIEFRIKSQCCKIIKKNFASDFLIEIYNQKKIEGLIKKCEEFIYRVGFVMNTLKNMESKDKSKLSIDDYYNVLDGIFETLEFSNDMFNYLVENLSTNINIFKEKTLKESKLNIYLEIIRKFGYIFLDIKQKNYSSVISNIVSIADSIFELSNTSDSKIKNSVFKIRTFAIKYGAFISAIVKAQNSDEVKKAIEAATLPAGSYRIKREQKFSISFNSYVGLFGNSESYIRDEFDTVTSSNKTHRWNLAITAPIGFAFNFGINSRPKMCFTIFTSIIDLGAIVRYQFKKNKDSTENADEKNSEDTSSYSGLSELRWKDILSPGLFFLVNLNRLPISVGGGVQMAPSLKNVDSDGKIELIEKKRIRLGLTFLIDIPLIHFK